MLELLTLPFLACCVLVGIHCQFGLQVLQRKVIFVDLALAQVAALGATVAFMLGHPAQGWATYAWSLGFAWGAAGLLSLVRFAPRGIPSEALIGVLYVVAAAAALLLIEKAPQGAEHLKQVLTGNVLTINAEELTRVIPVYLALGALLAWAMRHGWWERPGLGGWLADLGFYAALGLVVTSSVALAGVLLVFAFLIIPALVGTWLVRAPRHRLWVGWAAGTLASAGGLAAAYGWDLSPGASLVCALGGTLLLAMLVRAATAEGLRRGVTAARWALALVLTASASWLLLQPRADQPLLDALEQAWPAVRNAYLSADEQAIYADALDYAVRYERETARLQDMEERSRWQGQARDEEWVRKLSSFLQSYNEMIKGERFVMAESRARARERERPWLALAMLLLALPVAPLRWRRQQAAR